LVVILPIRLSLLSRVVACELLGGQRRTQDVVPRMIWNGGLCNGLTGRVLKSPNGVAFACQHTPRLCA
jgi:hypothetical protein